MAEENENEVANNINVAATEPGSKESAALTSIQRETFFGMYSGHENQANISTEILARARRASQKLAEPRKSRTRTLNKTVRQELDRMAASGERKPLDDFNFDLDDVEIPPEWEDEESSLPTGASQDNAELQPSSPVPAPAPEEQAPIKVEELEDKMKAERNKDAEKTRQAKMKERMQCAEGVDVKDFDSVHSALHNMKSSQNRVGDQMRLRTQVLTDKFDKLWSGRSKEEKKRAKTIDSKFTVTQVGKRKTHTIAEFCDKETAEQLKLEKKRSSEAQSTVLPPIS